LKLFIKRYRLFLALAVINVFLVFVYPSIGSKSIEVSKISMMKMFVIIPPIFLLLGLFDVWVPRETIIRLMGENSRLVGIVLALLLGSFAAGPLYAAFPVAAVLMNKGSKLSNIILFIGAWATIKIPMLLFEAGAMGWPFMLTRLSINIPGIIIMAYLVEMFISKNEKEAIYESALSQ
jgi:uncharacterized membrane protein YraQ (UPF0718 family)